MTNHPNLDLLVKILQELYDGMTPEEKATDTPERRVHEIDEIFFPFTSISKTLSRVTDGRELIRLAQRHAKETGYDIRGATMSYNPPK